MSSERHAAGRLAAVIILLAHLWPGGLAATRTFADTVDDPARPRTGLVLGGGGAKGAAHVGVIKVLESLGVEVDVVVGTSMGSIVGGLYAAGLDGAELQAAIESIDWVDIFNDDPPRADRSFRRKRDDSEVLIRYRLGVRDGAVRLPDGVILGQKLGLTLRRLAQRAPERANFDDLPIPYRAVATDLETGDTVVLGAGSLARAMHASMSVPGVFPPIEIDGRLLVDGGVVNNLPISVARELGAERLIVVNVASELLPREALTGAVAVAEQSLNLALALETRRQLATLGPDDILIKPALGDLTSADFERSTEAIAIGEAAATLVSNRLEALATPNRARPSPPAAPRSLAPLVTAIRIENETPLDDRVLASHLTIRPGDRLDREQLEADISSIYGLGYFETVDYRIEPGMGGSEVVIVAREREIGLGSLRFGLTLESNFSGDSGFNFITEYQVLGVNSLGGEWRSALAFGQDVFVFTEFFQPLDHDQRWFVQPSAQYRQSDVGVFEDGDRAAVFRVESGLVGLDIGRAFANCCELRAGVHLGAGEARLDTGAASLSGGTFQLGGVRLSAGLDTLDSARFPRSGVQVGVVYDHQLEVLGADAPSQSAELGGIVARSSGPHTLLASGELGLDLGGSPGVEELFSLGGMFNLSGFARDEVSGNNKVFGNLSYYYRLSDLAGFDFGVPLYAGASLEYGGVYEDLDDFGARHNFVASALFAGADTPLGPLYLGYGMAEGGNRSLYLFLGQNF